MAQEIKRKIVLEGEKEYSAALQAANRNLKTLRSELKAETAELGKNATEQQKNELRAKSLQKQIAEQEKVVKTLREALDQAKKEYGDNEAVVGKWEQKLNDARATLANMKNDLDGMDTGLKQATTDAAQMTVATKSAADAIGGLASAGDSVAGAIEGIFGGILETMENTVSAIWGMISETAARANNWTDLASYYGSDPAKMQQWSNAVQAAKGNYQDLIALVNTLSFGGKNKEIAEWFQVSDAEYTDNLEYTVAVLGRMAELKDEMVRSGTWDEAMTAVFGAKKAQNVSWFVANWDTIQRELETFDAENGGFGIDAESIATLNEVAVTAAEIETKWQAIRDLVAAAFAPRALDLAVNVSGGLDALNHLLSAETQEEREAALAELRENVEAFFQNVKTILEEGIAILGEVGEELQSSEDPVVRAIGDIFTAIRDALEWMVNNQDAVVTALEAIFGVWLVARLGMVAAKLVEIVAQIRTIQTLGGLSAAGEAAGAGAAGVGVGAAITKVLGSGLLKLGAAGYTAYKILTENTEKGDAQWDSWYYQGKVTEAGRAEGLPETEAEYYALYGQKQDAGQESHPEEEEDSWREMFGRQNGYGAGISLEQKAAAEMIWDIARGNQSASPAELERLWGAFGDNEELMDKLDEVMSILISQYQESREDLPASWWLDSESWKTGGSALSEGDLQSLRGLPGNIAAAVKIGAAEGVSGITVQLDGYTVGRLVAPYVSETIARDVIYG